MTIEEVCVPLAHSVNMYYTRVGGGGYRQWERSASSLLGIVWKCLVIPISFDITNNFDIQVEGLFVSPVSIGTGRQMVSTQFAVQWQLKDCWTAVCLYLILQLSLFYSERCWHHWALGSNSYRREEQTFFLSIYPVKRIIAVTKTSVSCHFWYIYLEFKVSYDFKWSER